MIKFFTKRISQIFQKWKNYRDFCGGNNNCSTLLIYPSLRNQENQLCTVTQLINTHTLTTILITMVLHFNQ